MDGNIYISKELKATCTMGNIFERFSVMLGSSAPYASIAIGQTTLIQN